VTVASILAELGAPVSNDNDYVRVLAKDSSKLMMWLEQHPFLHPVFFGSASKLKAFAKSLIPACVLDDEKNIMAAAARVVLQEHLVQNPGEVFFIFFIFFHFFPFFPIFFHFFLSR
jgi:hypothetical protein